VEEELKHILMPLSDDMANAIGGVLTRRKNEIFD
jgi:hypothetical protein